MLVPKGYDFPVLKKKKYCDFGFIKSKKEKILYNSVYKTTKKFLLVRFKLCSNLTIIYKTKYIYKRMKKIFIFVNVIYIYIIIIIFFKQYIYIYSYL